MRQRRQRRPKVCSLNLEALESRWAMSAPSGADLQLGQVVEQPWQSQQDGIRSTLADVHAATGLQHMRNAYGLSGAGQTVAVIDSGIAYDHYALGGGFGWQYRVVGGWDFAENDANPYDDGPGGFHGTHVAGIIGSSDSVHHGVAPAADLVALRVFDDVGLGYFSWVESALQWVHAHRNDFEHPITTVNLSLGSLWNSSVVPGWAMLEDEFGQLVRDGMFIAVSAGNEFAEYGTTGLSYPAASPLVVPVASTGNNGQISPFSQRHDRVIAAPGESITSTVPDFLFDFNGITDDFATASGTSMAAPYVAAASVILRQAMEMAGYQQVSQKTLYDHMRDTADELFDSVTGTSYHQLNLGRAVDALLAVDSIDSAATSWGAVDFRYLTGLNLGDGAAHYEFTATRTGTLTVDALGDGSAGPFGIELLDANGQLLASSSSPANHQRIDTHVAAGQTLHLRVFGGGTTVDLRVCNLVSLSDRGLAVFGTASDDIFTVAAGGPLRVTVNGVAYAWDRLLVSTVSLLGAGGRDSLVIDGTSESETVVLRESSLEMKGAGLTVTAQDVALVLVNGGGGDDRAVIHDAKADDQFHAWPDHALIRYAAGASNTVRDFDRVAVHGTAGGYDRAYLHDSTGDDRFTGSADSSLLVGPGFFQSVTGFDRVDAYATAGGYDRAQLYDSPGDDRFTGRADYSVLLGQGFFNVARGFDRVDAHAAGGYDRARLYDSTGDDQFTGRPEYGALTGHGFSNVARGFERVDAYATEGGYDRAHFHDSADGDRFTGRVEYSVMVGQKFQNVARGFDRVDAYATAGGYDQAGLFDLTSGDRLTARAEYHVLAGPGFLQVVRGFERVDAHTSADGYAPAEGGATLPGAGDHPAETDDGGP